MKEYVVKSRMVCPEETGTKKGGKNVAESYFTRDGGRSPGIGNQVLTPNHPWVLQSKAMVLSARGKGWITSQVGAMGLNESEQLTKHR